MRMLPWKILNTKITAMERNKAISILKGVFNERQPDYADKMYEADKVEDIIDSLDRIDVAIDLERIMNVNIPDETVECWITIKDIVDTIEKIGN